MKNLKRVLVEFGFQRWKKSNPPGGYYVRIVENDNCWIMKSSKEECESEFENVVDSITDGQDPSIIPVAVDSGGNYFEEGLQIIFSNNTQLTASRPTR